MGKSTEKLFSKNPDVSNPSVLGSWSAHLVIFARMRFVLFVNVKTLLTIFIHLTPKEDLLLRFQQALFKELLRLGIPSDETTEEALRYQDFSLEKNTDRSMAGYMNQMAFEYKIFLQMHLEEHGTFEPEVAQELTNRSPHVKREHDFPDHHVRELFGVDDPNKPFH